MGDVFKYLPSARDVTCQYRQECLRSNETQIAYQLCSLKSLFCEFNEFISYCEAGRGAEGTKCDCKIDWLWVRSPLGEVKYLFTFIFSFLRSGVEAKRGFEFCNLYASHAMPPEFGGKLGTVCLNTRFPLPHTVGYCVRDTA